MKIKRFIGGNLESNGYVLYDKEGGEAFIIDPGYLPERFLKSCSALNLSVKGILLTHHHYDHVGAVERLKKEWNCPVYLHWQDIEQYKKNVDGMLEGGEVFLLGEEEIRVIHTPGHTHGSVCFFSEKSKCVFTGDTIFNIDLGRTDLADGSEQEMRRTVREIISRWNNDITIYPGHGDSATMKYVHMHNREYLDLL
ncbi:MBL fold metallo-hydrolase [Sinanaerobacter sp. ZZT-01]|uniref:MBL fold metallo-hydrolase n=1 Tax=Sinanaerobacter sp. ZZT-01 TaxID=3111540 RepID=UPI002D7699AA|nr:MBL fold metallo-hydrolase [Sinanaerobacter sp. ZZT-01]WRR93443.1 MBL fold metallo-hydrolase [Sinanaerobacter sp. ZZT-01]